MMASFYAMENSGLIKQNLCFRLLGGLVDCLQRLRTALLQTVINRFDLRFQKFNELFLNQKIPD